MNKFNWRLKNESQVDLYKGGAEVSWEKPAEVRKTFKNRRWRKYLMMLYRKKNENHLSQYANYLKQTWKDQHEQAEALARLDIYYMLEKTLPNYETPVVEKIKMWSHERMTEY